MKNLTKSDIKILAKSNNISEREFLILLAEIVKSSYSKLFFETEFNLSNHEFDKLLTYIERRSMSEPISKILEKKEFYGINFKTNQHTLDPRPETELIIDMFQKYYQDKNQKLSILDLGSGTGCIGLSILSLYKNAMVDFVDISQNALNVAIQNSKNLEFFDRSKFILSNWFENITEKYDIIVSNPPYISDGFDLDAEVLYDPSIALFAGSKGMDAYNIIIPNASNYLHDNGKLFLEIGFDQKQKILTLNNNLKVLEIAKDISGIDRTFIFEKYNYLTS